MSNYFLIKKDFERIITLEDLDKITRSNDQLWKDSIFPNTEMIKSYLRHRYDVAVAFSSIFLHSNSTEWSIGDRVIESDVLYYAIQDVPIGILISDTAYWVQGDTRNLKVVEMTTQFVLYTLYSRLNSVDIPQYLQIIKDDNMSYLKDIQKGNVDIDLPLLAAIEDGTDQSGNRIIFVNSSTLTETKFVP